MPQNSISQNTSIVNVHFDACAPNQDREHFITPGTPSKPTSQFHSSATTLWFFEVINYIWLFRISYKGNYVFCILLCLALCFELIHAAAGLPCSRRRAEFRCTVWIYHSLSAHQLLGFGLFQAQAIITKDAKTTVLLSVYNFCVTYGFISLDCPVCF